MMFERTPGWCWFGECSRESIEFSLHFIESTMHIGWIKITDDVIKYRKSLSSQALRVLPIAVHFELPLQMRSANFITGHCIWFHKQFLTQLLHTNICCCHWFFNLFFSHLLPNWIAECVLRALTSNDDSSYFWFMKSTISLNVMFSKHRATYRFVSPSNS